MQRHTCVFKCHFVCMQWLSLATSMLIVIFLVLYHHNWLGS